MALTQLRNLFDVVIVKVKKPSQHERILRVARSKGYISNHDMWDMRIQRGSERIRELKSEGHLFVGQRDTGTRYLYIYKGHQDEVA